jgi:hypothetical protein
MNPVTEEYVSCHDLTSHSYGASSSANPDTGALCPIVIRSGSAVIQDCEFWLTGWKSADGSPYSGNGKFGINRVVGVVTDQYSSKVGAGTEPVITIRDSFVRQFVGNGAAVQADVDLRFGKYTWDNSASIAKATADVQALRDQALKLTAQASAALAAAQGGSGDGGAVRVWKGN